MGTLRWFGGCLRQRSRGTNYIEVIESWVCVYEDLKRRLTSFLRSESGRFFFCCVVFWSIFVVLESVCTLTRCVISRRLHTPSTQETGLLEDGIDIISEIAKTRRLCFVHACFCLVSGDLAQFSCTDTIGLFLMIHFRVIWDTSIKNKACCFHDWLDYDLYGLAHTESAKNIVSHGLLVCCICHHCAARSYS